MSEKPDRFALTEQTAHRRQQGLWRFSCDYDPDVMVTLDCEDQERAEALLAMLNDQASNFLDVYVSCGRGR